MTDTTAKKDIQKLQRAIVDGLEDVKALDIKVFDTTRLSPLFERVLIASGSSNRQTKALAASVRDKLREAGFPKPRTEGEDNGEWIIVDCGAAVVHVMQPSIRTYYNLEEIWGETPVRVKLGARRPAAATRTSAAKGDKAVPAKTGRAGTPSGAADTSAPRKGGRKTASTSGAGTTSVSRKSAGKSPISGASRGSSASKKEVKKVIVPATARKTPARKTADPAKPAKKTTSRRT